MSGELALTAPRITMQLRDVSALSTTQELIHVPGRLPSVMTIEASDDFDGDFDFDFDMDDDDDDVEDDDDDDDEDDADDDDDDDDDDVFGDEGEDEE